MGPLMRTDRDYPQIVASPQARFCSPRSTSALIARPGLSARIENSAKLTLLQAPPGSGKSTLLAQWPEHSHIKHRVAWLLCGQRDRDAVHFFSSLATSVDQAMDLGDPVTSTTAATWQCSAEHLVDALCDRLSSLQDELVIAIDDLQFLDCAESEHQLWSLIAQSAPCVRWIVATRQTPRFDLQRLKLIDQLTVLNGSDLSFQPEQIAELALLLNGTALSPLAAAECCRRTEGWIAGVKLALLDHAGADLGDALNYDVVAYLNSAAWESLSESLQDALLATCICDRFCAELADALLEIPGSGRLLDEMERLQLFVQPLDGKHRWFRYHTLYREFLNAQLRKLWPQHVIRLHRAASHWFAEQELPAEALQHAFATEDRYWCVQLVARCAPVWLRTGEFPEVLRWTSRLSMAEIMSCAAVRDAHLMSLIFSRHFERARTELLIAKFEAPQSRALPALQLMLDIMTDAGVHVTAHEVEALSVTDDPYLTANLFNVSAYQLLVDKKFDAARRLALRGRELLTGTQHVYALAQAAVVLMLVDRAEGHARDAAETCMQLYARARAGRRNPIWVTAATAAASVHYHHNRLQLAEALCSEVLPLVSMAPSLENLTVAHVVAARLKCATEKYGDALRLLDYLHSVLESSNCKRLLARVCFEKVRIHLLHEQLARALAVLAEFGQDERDEPWEDFTLSRVAVLIHRGSFDIAAGQLRQLCEQAEAAGDVYGQIRLEATLATCHWQARDEETAFYWINHALALTENRGFSRAVFDDVFCLPKTFAAAIKRARVTQLPSPEYFQRFHDVLAFDPYKELSSAQTDALLTQRELDLLKLVSMGLSNRDISERSNITLLTTKWHLKNVFAKLGVSTRMEAVFRAQELRLVDGRPPSPSRN